MQASGSSSGMKWPHGNGLPVTGWSGATQRRHVARNASLRSARRRSPHRAWTGHAIVRPAARSASSRSLSNVAPAR